MSASYHYSNCLLVMFERQRESECRKKREREKERKRDIEKLTEREWERD